ncbi:uncharacterized protein LOC114872859 isoform X1 [Osmia bicornis bicornis]|uniref:uncharacterized protein LOC114872859 isoform X1 n=1 Tax=Osmia bicornis bicornis TaxID=1437191 RepID=UPI0010F6F8F1|nr:uncharacterized protein LOC114872859 isoform X1 [Osmia bicornis bicornis]
MAAVGTSSLCTLLDLENKTCTNHVSHKKCKSCYYICLGVLAHTIHKQIQNKGTRNNDLNLVGSKYLKDLYEWVCQCKHNQTTTNEFLMPFIASIALFAVGIKLTNELVAWKLF